MAFAAISTLRRADLAKIFHKSPLIRHGVRFQPALRFSNSSMSTSTPVLPSPVTGSPEAIQAELRAEATAVERLRQQIQAKGAAATKVEMAEYAKRQKAYLDRKIDF